MNKIYNFHSFINEGLFETDNSIKKYEKLIIDAVIAYMKNKLSFDAKITVKKKNSKNMIGDIQLNANSIDNNKFTLHFNPNQSTVLMIKSLIHELTHVKQVSKGELTTVDYKSILWKNDIPLDVKTYNKMMRNVKNLEGYNKYNDLPWEKEARLNMENLYLDFIESDYWKNLKGKDVTVDFIMDNL